MIPPSRGRLLGAVITTLIVALVVGAGAGWAGSTDPGTTFVVAPPYEGDRAEYAVERDSVIWEGRDLGPWRLAWLSGRAVQHGDGSWQGVHVLRSELDWSSEDGERDWTSWAEFYQAPGGQVVQTRASQGRGSGAAGSGFLLFEYEESSQQVRDRTHYREGRLPCGFRLDTLTLQVGDSVAVYGGCFHGETRTMFEAVGIEDVEGIPAIRIDAANNDTMWSLWYASDVSMPLRREFTLHFPAGFTHQGTPVETGVITEQMIGYERGSAPLSVPDRVPAPVDLPEVELAARQPWGPDDSGLDHPFPASAAWLVAPRHSAEFDAFLSRHPDAAATALEFGTTPGPDPSMAWWFDVVGGDEVGSLWIIRDAVIPWSRVPGGSPVTPPTESYSYQAFFHERDGGSHAVRASDLPTQLPSVASVLARWELMAPPDHGAGLAPGWTMGGVCLNECDAGDFEVSAGRAPEGLVASHFLDFIDWFDGGDQETILNGSHLVVTGAGIPRAWDTWLTTRSTSVDGPLAQPSPSSPESGAPARRDVLAMVSWSLPPPPAAASIGGLALVAGVFYYVWPSIKSAPLLGLFSRLRSSALLEHPARAAAMELVEAEPGIHLSELVRRLDSSESTVMHHLRALERGDRIRLRRTGRYTCAFPAGASRDDIRAAAVLKARGARVILEEVVRRPGVSAGEVAALIGLDAGTVSHHTARLAEAGLVERVRSGRYVHLHPCAGAEAVMGRVSPPNPADVRASRRTSSQAAAP